MAQIIRRKRSPFWYARFHHAGKAYLMSTNTTKRAEALQFLQDKLREVTGGATLDDTCRAALQRMKIAVAPEEDAPRRLLAALIAFQPPTAALAPVAERLRVAEAAAAAQPAQPAQVSEDRRAWLRGLAAARGAAITLDRAWDAWLRAPRKRGAGDSTMDSAYGPAWQRFERWAAGRGLKHLHDLAPADAADYLSFLQAKELSAKTIRNHRGFLIAVWNALKLQGGLTENPWAALPAPEAEPSVRRALTVEQLRSLFAAAADPEDKLAIALGLFAALRLGDVANLPWTAVRFAEGMIVLQPSKTKRYGREVRIPLHPALRESLTARRAAFPEGEWVCPKLHALYAHRRDSAGQHVVHLFEKAGIPLHGEKLARRQRAPSLGAFHALRHSFISFAARAGVPQLAVRRKHALRTEPGTH